ncbi:helix-turn-helix domain-containing protein [Streptomyces radicis]|uniref:Helix-turn-helix domain-containing protein n=1 Tax=Streptomyces radicis TaxID=1750517 RepID=A0A3A9W0P1_9ACTN|nr:helix-turn-helix domain-containing protein [Streptomyces radicis]RKN06795.1 helix-turn-helix domain-containing protein [Streptomyces radicis]RKN19413.1 helix-turn-helix domain-containing protein [Streptomyces radicis]
MSNGNSSAKDRLSVGRILQQARIDAKLTVDEVSSSTRVRIPIVQAIEQDDFSRCGGDVYARGHIRTLARAVGADAGELIELFNEQQGSAPPLLSSGPLFEAERIRPEPRRPNWTAAMVAAIVVVIGFVGFTFFSGGEGEDPGAVAEGSESPSPSAGQRTETPEQTEEPEEPAPEPSESAVAAPPADEVTVVATAEGGSSWISAKDANGGLIFQGVLQEGQSETFSDDDQIDLILGNAGAVRLHVNGSEIEDVFEMGQVERLSYTRGDPSEG